MKRLLKSVFTLGKNIVSLPFEEQAVLKEKLNEVLDKIAENPFTNLLGLLQTYKIFDNQVSGTLAYFHRSRNSLWFKHFFVEEELYQLVKQDIEDLYPKYKHIKLLISDRGLVVYDNYQKNAFNVLLITPHSGSWIASRIREKMDLAEDLKTQEEDKGTDLIYRDIVLKNSGIWIDNKQSRFLCDYNRPRAKAIYDNESEYWLEKFWKNRLTSSERAWIMESYDQFYGLLSKLIQSYRFNIIFDGHSMRNRKGRPLISIGKKHVKPFYVPNISFMEDELRKKGYQGVKEFVPYAGGHISDWFEDKFPDVFIFSVEINKKLYMDSSETKLLKGKTKKLAKDMLGLFLIKK